MKIPFERTIAGAYRFAFSNILSVIGICWFPYLILSAMAGGLLYLLWPQIQDLVAAIQTGHGPDPAKFQSTFRLFLTAYGVLIPAFLIIGAMVTVGMMRKALGQHPSPVFVFFSLGSQVWRLVGAYFLLALLFYGMIIVLAVVVGGVWAGLNRYSAPAATPVAVTLGIAAGLWCIYAFVRTYFFVPAIVVAENHIGLRRSWHLGYGNFWRIVGIILIVSLPIGMAASTISSTMLQLAMTPGMAVQQGPMTNAEFHKLLAELLPAARRIGPYYVLVQLLYFALLAGLSAGAVATAYKAVTGDTEAKATV
ncbi:MAG TPA: hypothetical protein VJ476_08940 [Rhizomicrobium sp.]|nr:hypothetical protein [Rhizomicrobium sp.]